MTVKESRTLKLQVSYREHCPLDIKKELFHSKKSYSRSTSSNTATFHLTSSRSTASNSSSNSNSSSSSSSSSNSSRPLSLRRRNISDRRISTPIMVSPFKSPSLSPQPDLLCKMKRGPLEEKLTSSHFVGSQTFEKMRSMVDHSRKIEFSSCFDRYKNTKKYLGGTRRGSQASDHSIRTVDVWLSSLFMPLCNTLLGWRGSQGIHEVYWNKARTQDISSFFSLWSKAGCKLCWFNALLARFSYRSSLFPTLEIFITCCHPIRIWYHRLLHFKRSSNPYAWRMTLYDPFVFEEDLLSCQLQPSKRMMTTIHYCLEWVSLATMYRCRAFNSLSDISLFYDQEKEKKMYKNQIGKPPKK